MPLVVGEDGVFVLPATVKARYPQFSTVDDATVESYILEARLYVDMSWPEASRALAQTHAAAHFMTLSGLGSTAASAPVAVATDREVQSFRLDDLSVTFAAAPSMASGSGSSGPVSSWSSTAAGRQFDALRRRYFGGGYWVGS